MARVSKKQKKKSVRITLLYLASIIILSLVAFGYKWIDSYLQEQLTTFELVDIDIKGNSVLSRSEILELCGVKAGGTQLLTVKPMDVVRKLRQSPYVKAASAVHSLPSKLRIVVIERKPLAFIYGKGLNMIDDEGFLVPLPRSDASWNLPFITGVKGSLGRIGERTVAAQALKAVELIAYSRFLNSPVSDMIAEVNVKDIDNIKLRLIRGGAVVKITSDRYQDNLNILSRYFEQYLDWQLLSSVEYFDVRFKDQLIVKEKKS